MATATAFNTGIVRASYLHVNEPKADDKGNLKYQGMFIIKKDDKKTLDQFNAAVQAAFEAGKGILGVKGDKIPSSLKTPLRDGDEDRPDDPACKGCYFFNASSNSKPGVVNTGKPPKPITDPDEIYSGMFVRVAINLYAFNNQSKGIAVGFNGLQKVKDGDRLDGRVDAEVIFNDGTEWDDEIYNDDEDDNDDYVM